MAESNGKEVAEEKKEEVKKRRIPVKLIALFTAGLLLFGGGIFLWKAGLLSSIMGKEKEAIAAKKIDTSKPDIGPMYPMETFIVNLVDPHGKRYLKLRLELELESDEVRPEVDRRMPQFKDSIITLLSSKAYEDVNSLEGKLQMRAEMISMLNQSLRTGVITNIYFTEFIVQ